MRTRPDGTTVRPRSVGSEPRGSGAGLTSRTVSGLLWTAWGKGGHALLQVAVVVVLARLLRPADFGVVSAALVVIGFSAIFSEIGLGPALVQRTELETRHLQAAFSASFLFGLVLAGIVALGAPLLADFLRMPPVVPVLRALAWLFPLNSLAVVPEALMRRQLRFRWLANLEVLSYGAGYGLVGTVLAMRGFGVWALVAGNFAQSLLRLIVLLIAQGRPPVGVLPEGRALRDLMYFGSGHTVARVAHYWALQGDNLVVGRWLGPAVLGLYGRAYTLMATPAALFGEILDNVLFPVMALVQGEQQRLALAYRRGIALIALIMLPASALLCVTAPEIVGVVLGPRWTGAVAALQILGAGLLFRTSHKMSDSIARATGAVYRRAWRQGVYAALVIGGAWVGQHWGIAGVAYAVLVALTINFLLMAQLGLRLSGLQWRSFWSAHLPALNLAVASGAAAWAVAGALRHADLPAASVLVATLGITLGWALLLVRYAPGWFLGQEGLWMLETLRTRAPFARGSASRPMAAELR